HFQISLVTFPLSQGANGNWNVRSVEKCEECRRQQQKFLLGRITTTNFSCNGAESQLAQHSTRAPSARYRSGPCRKTGGRQDLSLSIALAISQFKRRFPWN